MDGPDTRTPVGGDDHAPKAGNRDSSPHGSRRWRAVPRGGTARRTGARAQLGNRPGHLCLDSRNRGLVALFPPLAAELAHTATVHNIDLPGHGSTPKPSRTLSVRDYAHAVWDALDDLGVRRPTLVGHSMGAQVAVEMANMRAAAAPAIVLLGPTNYAPERGFWRQSLRLGHDTLRRPWKVNAIVFSDYAFRCGLPWYFRTVPMMLSNRIEDTIATVQVPVLVVRGTRDPIVPAAWISALAYLAPRGTMAQVEGKAM